MNTTLTGTNLIADPFYQVDDNALNVSDTASGFYGAPMNTVGSLFSGNTQQLRGNGGTFEYVPVVTHGTTFADWTGDGFVTDTNNAPVFDPSTGNVTTGPPWLPNGDVTLLPGMGVMAVLPTNSTSAQFWFIGLVRESVTNQIQVGANYLGSALPIAGGISSVLGFTAQTYGDVLVKWDPTNQVAVSFTNFGGTNWSPIEPSIGIGEGFILVSVTNQTWVQTLLPCPGLPGGNSEP
jgi:hypothetical protein